MDTRYVTFGALAYFFPAGRTFTVDALGATVSATPASRTARPGAADNNWLTFGDNVHVKTKITRTAAEKLVWAPGGWRPAKRQNVSRKVEATLKLHQCSNLVWELLFGSLPLPISPAGGGQYSALEGLEVEGWLQLQYYPAEGTSAINAVVNWVDLELTSEVDFGPKEFECDLLATFLQSTQNTGNLA